jgi:nitrate/nitrite transporter NarK
VLFILLFKEYSIKDINRKTVGRGSIIESNKYCFNLESIKFCLTSKMLIANYVAVFAFGYLLFFYLTWLPGYLIEKFNLNILSVGYLSSIPWAIATVMVIAGGCLSDLLLKKTKSKRVAHVHLFWIFMLLSSLSSVLLVFSESIAIDITVMSLALGFGLASNSLFFSLCRDISPNYVGAATGVAITFFSLSGIISPYLTGILRDSYGSFDSAIMVLSTIMFFSALLLIIFCKPDEH